MVQGLGSEIILLKFNEARTTVKPLMVILLILLGAYCSWLLFLWIGPGGGLPGTPLKVATPMLDGNIGERPSNVVKNFFSDCNTGRPLDADAKLSGVAKRA